MNSEKIMKAIGGIDDGYIEKYAVVKPVANDRINRIVVRRKWFYRLCACLAAIAIVLGIGFPILNNPGGNPSIIVTAYAMEKSNAVAEQALTKSSPIPVSLLETSDGLKGFLFSVDSATQDAPPSLAIFTAGAYEQKVGELIEIVGVDLEPGKQYFFFVGQSIDDFSNVSFFYSDEETKTTFEIGVKITETDAGFSAELEELKAFPTKAEE